MACQAQAPASEHPSVRMSWIDIRASPEDLQSSRHQHGSDRTPEIRNERKKTEMSVRVMIRTKSGIRRNGEMKWGELTVEWGRRLEVMRRLAGRDCWRSKMWKKPAIQPPMCLSICFSRFWSCTIPVIISSSCFSPFASLSTSSVVNEQQQEPGLRSPLPHSSLSLSLSLSLCVWCVWVNEKMTTLLKRLPLCWAFKWCCGG